MTQTFVITGTDTGIGKTIFAASLTKALGGKYFKPVQAGLEPETDSQIVAKLSGCAVLPEIYRLKLAASPHLAAESEGIEIDPQSLTLPDVTGPLIVEGAGGVMVPLTRNTLFLEVFARWRVPIVLCARTTLGTINHSLMSIAALKYAGCSILGIAFIGEEMVDSEKTICQMGKVHRLGRLPIVSPLDGQNLARVFDENFAISDFLPQPDKSR